MASAWDKIVEAFSSAVAQTIEYLPKIIGAIVVILIGYLVGLIVKKTINTIINRLFEKPLEKTKLGKLLREAGISLGSLIGNLVMALIIAVSIVAAVDILELTGYTGQLVSTIALAILNVTAGITILAIGIPLAILAAEFLSSFLLGPFKEKHELAVTLVYDITALVLSVFVIALAVNVMFGYHILLDYMASAAPGFIGAAVILFIGYILGDAIGKIVNKIVDTVIAKPLEATDIGKSIREAHVDLPGLISGLTKAFVIIVSIVAAVEILNIGGLTGQLIYQIALYLPKLIGGIAISTLGLILSIVLARYIGRFIRVVFKDKYESLADLAENLIVLGLIAVVVTIALNTLQLQGDLVYPLITGIVIIVAGIFVAEIIGELLKGSHPTYERLVPFLETLVILIFVITGVGAIFSQFQGVLKILTILAIGISIAFAVVLVPMIFHYTRLAWHEAAKASKK